MVTEDRKGDGLVLGATINRNVALPVTSILCQLGVVQAIQELDLAKSTMRKLNVAAFGPDQAVGSLSGGNQQKVVLGKWLATLPSVLLLDEPTRGIDIGAKAEIYKLVRELASERTVSQLGQKLGVAAVLITVPAAGLAVGALTGVIIAKGKLQPFIVTLAMMVAVTGALRLIAGPTAATDRSTVEQMRLPKLISCAGICWGSYQFKECFSSCSWSSSGSSWNTLPSDVMFMPSGETNRPLVSRAFASMLWIRRVDRRGDKSDRSENSDNHFGSQCGYGQNHSVHRRR